MNTTASTDPAYAGQHPYTKWSLIVVLGLSAHAVWQCRRPGGRARACSKITAHQPCDHTVAGV